MSALIKNYKYAFTTWKKPSINKELCIFLVWQKEICNTTKLEHYQGYVEFKKYYTLGQAKQCFKDKTIHLEIAKESRNVNYLYCTKNESFANERYEYGDIDTGLNNWPG